MGNVGLMLHSHAPQIVPSPELGSHSSEFGVFMCVISECDNSVSVSYDVNIFSSFLVLQIREGINGKIPVYQKQGITRHYHVAFWIMCFLKLASKYGLFKENLSIVSPKMFCKWNKKKKSLRTYLTLSGSFRSFDWLFPSWWLFRD